MSIALITGGNTGLGYESARRLKEMGHKVYIGCRNEEKAKKAAEELGVEYLIMDVSNDEAVKKAFEDYAKREEYLDILVNNAGIPGDYTLAKDVTVDIMKEVYEVNVFGIVRTTHAFIPMLEKSENPVIVNVSSGLGSFGQVLNSEKIESKVNAVQYCSSKSAASMLTVQYAKGLPNFKVNAVDPGPTNTGGKFKNGVQTLEEATNAIIKMATVDKNGPTCTFTDKSGVIPW